MRIRRFSLLVCLAGLMAIAASTAANSIQRIESTAGNIEFSNIPPNRLSDQYTVIYQFREDEQLIFSDQKPADGTYTLLKYDCSLCRAGSTIDWYNTRLNNKDYSSIINKISKKYSVHSALIRAIIHAESAFNSRAISSKGAQGLMQLMPSIQHSLAVKDPFDPEQNIDGGVKYLTTLLTQFDGDITLAIAAYHAGPSAVSRHNGVPPYTETRMYVERVAILHERYQNHP